MAFNNTIRRLTTADTTHADNFNDPLQKLLENDLDLNSKITVLSDKVEWKGTNWRSVDDLPSTYGTHVTTAFYTNQSWNGTGGAVITIREGGSLAEQKVIPTFGSGGARVRYEVSNDKWGSWQQLATTEKVPVICTPKTGLTIVGQKSYQINNIVYINFRISYTNGSQFSANAYVPIASLPTNKLPYSMTSLASCGLTTNGEPKSVVSSLCIGSDIYVIVGGTALNEITVTGSYVLEV